MADRFPLILNTSANQIQEIASGDTLDLSGNNIKGVGIITATNISGNIIAGAGTSNIVAGIVTAVTFKGDGDFVELDVDGHTNLDNVNIAGIVTANQIKLEDNKFLLLGNGNDLQLRHDGSHSYIQDTGTGNLYFTSNNFNFFSPTNEKYAVFNNNSSVELYWDNSKKFETSSTGITVTGTVVATGADINGDIDVDGHTNLDNLSVAGVSTFSGDVTIAVGTGGIFTLQGSGPSIELVDANANDDFRIHVNHGIFQIEDATNANADRLKIDSNGVVTIPGNTDFGAGIDVTGNITSTGNVVASGNVTAVDGTFSGNVSIGGTLTYEDVINVDSVGVITAREGIFLPDNKSIHLGNVSGGGDLQLYHTGSESYIKDAGTGRLRIQSSQLCLQSTTGENFLVANPDAATELYFNNVSKLATSNTGITVTGTLLATGSIDIPDSGKLLLGDGDDVQIYHNGTDSVMDVYTSGSFKITNNGSELMAEFKRNNAVELYHDGTKRLSTHSLGAIVNGPAFFIRGGTGENATLQFISNNSASYNDHYNLTVAATGAFALQTEVSANNFENLITATQNGSVELYHDNVKKLETKSTGAGISGALDVTGGSNAVNISHTSGHGLSITRSSKSISINANYGASNTHAAIEATSGMDIRFYLGGGEKIKFESAGNIVPTTDSQITLGNSGKRFTALWTDYVEASFYGSLGQYSGKFGAIRIGADVYGNTIKTQGDNNLNITVPHSVYFNTSANANGSDAGTARLRIYDGGIVPSNDKAVDLGSTSIAWRNVYTDNIVTTTALSNRNVIHNGTMFVAQRGTSQSGVNSSGYAKAADRWKLEANGSNVGTYTVSRSTDNPGEFGYSYKIQCTTAHSSLANNEMYEFVQYIEGRNVQRFNKGNSTAKPFALSFSVKTNKTGTYAVLLLDHQNSRMCCANYTVSNTGWNRYEIVFPADTSGAWTYSVDYRLSVKFCLLTGGLFQGGTLQTTWGATSNQNSRVGHNVNLADTVGNTFYITGVQLEAASACTPYEHKDYTEVVRECQRYLYTTPILGAGVWNGTSSFFTACHVPVPMRIHPTVTTNSGGFGNINIEHTDTYGVNSFTNPSVGHGNPNSTAAQSYSGYSSFIIGLGVTYSIDEIGRGGLVVCDAASDFFILDAQL